MLLMAMRLISALQPLVLLILTASVTMGGVHRAPSLDPAPFVLGVFAFCGGEAEEHGPTAPCEACVLAKSTPPPTPFAVPERFEPVAPMGEFAKVDCPAQAPFVHHRVRAPPASSVI